MEMICLAVRVIDTRHEWYRKGLPMKNDSNGIRLFGILVACVLVAGMISCNLSSGSAAAVPDDDNTQIDINRGDDDDFVCTGPLCHNSGDDDDDDDRACVGPDCETLSCERITDDIEDALADIERQRTKIEEGGLIEPVASACGSRACSIGSSNIDEAIDEREKLTRCEEGNDRDESLETLRTRTFRSACTDLQSAVSAAFRSTELAAYVEAKDQLTGAPAFGDFRESGIDKEHVDACLTPSFIYGTDALLSPFMKIGINVLCSSAPTPAPWTDLSTVAIPDEEKVPVFSGTPITMDLDVDQTPEPSRNASCDEMGSYLDALDQEYDALKALERDVKGQKTTCAANAETFCTNTRTDVQTDATEAYVYFKSAAEGCTTYRSDLLQRIREIETVTRTYTSSTLTNDIKQAKTACTRAITAYAEWNEFESPGQTDDLDD